jgi:ferredoxin, 2Fe-2S
MWRSGNSASIFIYSELMMVAIKFIADNVENTPAIGQFDLNNGVQKQFQAQPGQSLMKAFVSAGIDGIAADCGGTLTCATCHVIVDEAWATQLPPPQPDELAMLDMTAAPRQATSRLSCQIALTPALDGLSLRLPATQY